MELLQLPFAALGALLRWGNDQYRRAMARFWGFALLYLGTLWLGAALDARWLIVGGMWVATFAVVNFYLQPSVAGVLGMIEYLRKGDEPNRASVLRAGLMVFITVISAGGIALIAGAIGAAKVFPYAIIVILTVVACAVAAGGAAIEKWLKRIAALAAISLAVATVGALHPAVFVRLGILPASLSLSEAEKAVAEGAEANYRAADKTTREAIERRFAAKMEAGTMTPEDWSEVSRLLAELKGKASITTDPLSDADREVREKRSAKRKEWALLIQRCRVSAENVARFTPEQQALYREKCGEGAAVRGLTLEEVKAKWPELFVAESASARGARGKDPSETLRSIWEEFMGLKDTNFWLWLLLVHILFLPFFYWPLKWAWKKYVKKEDAAATATNKKSTATGAAGLVGVAAIVAAAILLAQSGGIGKAWDAIASTPERIAYRNAVPAAPISIGEVNAANPKGIRDLAAVLGGDFVGTGLPRAQRDTIYLAIKEGSYLRHDQVYLRICASELCRSDDPPEASDVVLGGRCELLIDTTRRRCRGTWQIAERGFVRTDLTFELVAFPTSVTIDAYRPNEFGKRDDAFSLKLFPNPRPAAGRAGGEAPRR